MNNNTRKYDDPIAVLEECRDYTLSEMVQHFAGEMKRLRDEERYIYDVRVLHEFQRRNTNPNVKIDIINNEDGMPPYYVLHRVH
jgi:hypothetical protein